MFTGIASRCCSRYHLLDRAAIGQKAVQRAMVFDDDIVRQNVVFARRDLRLIAWMLAAILVMLGIIADRVH
jgi:hypothetical protein